MGRKTIYRWRNLLLKLLARNVSRSKSWISRASWWFRSKTTINIINLLNFACRNLWRLLKHKSRSMKAGYTPAEGIQPTVSITPAFPKSSLLTALPEFRLYRLNVILQVSWIKYTAGNGVWVCYIDQIYLTLCKYCIPNCDESGVCEPDSLLGSCYLLWKNYSRKELLLYRSAWKYKYTHSVQTLRYLTSTGPFPDHLVLALESNSGMK